MHHDNNYYGLWFLRALGIFMAAMSWYPVIYRRTVRWKGSRARLSTRSKVVFATGTTAWCLGVFGVYPIYCAMVFATCVLLLFPLATQDRRAYGNLPFAPGVRPERLSRREQWRFFRFVDVLALLASGFAMVRDLYSPPATDEQHLVHVMGLAFFALSVIGALALFLTWPRKEA